MTLPYQIIQFEEKKLNSKLVYDIYNNSDHEYLSQKLL